MDLQQPASRNQGIASTMNDITGRKKVRKLNACFILPVEDHRRLKRAAIDHGVTMSELVTAWIESTF